MIKVEDYTNIQSIKIQVEAILVMIQEYMKRSLKLYQMDGTT